MSKRATAENNLETRCPDLAKEWHPLLNGGLQPNAVLPGSNKNAVWQCLKCGYVWEARIINRVNGRGCPCCSNKVVVRNVNDLATTHHDIAKEWYQPLNGDVTPSDITHGCGKKFYWLCPRGHVYSATVLHRTSGIGTNCPICNSGRQTSFAEQALYFYVKKVFPDTLNRYKEIFKGGMELDIFIPTYKVGIEYDGEYWHHRKDNSHEKEQRKYDFCKKLGIELIRVREKSKASDESPAADWCYFFLNEKFDETLLNQMIENVLRKVISYSQNDSILLPDINIKRDKFDILAYLQGPVKNSVQAQAPELINEWDNEKNGNLKPDMISGGSSQYVNWVCSVCGYRWEAQIYHRVKEHTGCPKCAGLVLEKGINDLASKNKELLKDWDYEVNSKNGIFPNEIIFNSTKKVNWKCHICGHRWTISVRSRTVLGDGCIKCGYKSGKDLKQKKLLEKQGCIADSKLLQEWDYDRNAEIGLYPNELTPGSNKSAFWTCSKCGHKWSAPISRRSKGAGCKRCADRNNPELKRKKLIADGRGLNNELLLKEWDYDRNIKAPKEYTFGSKEKVYWICSKCSYRWSAAINTRNKGVGCPACAGHIAVTGKNDLASKHPELLNEWDNQKNKDIDPSQVAYSSGRKFWRRCLAGHDSYLASPSHRVKGTGCPICGNMKIGAFL